MTLADSVQREIASTLGLRPQPEWVPAIAAAIDACGGSASSADKDHRTRLLLEVAKRITVPETHFFRNHAQLAACADHLATVARRENRIAKLWCAGSATGEEPYTLAILVDRQEGAPLAQRLEITASDINPEAVRKARQASYTSWSFRGAPGWCFSYFEPSAPGQVTLRSSPIRGVVTFDVESCQAGARARADASLDVVSFRNVAIYLEESATRELHREFSRLLRPGGLLAIGPSDPRPVEREFEFVDYFDDAALYRRVEVGAVKSEPYKTSPSYHPTNSSRRAEARKAESRKLESGRALPKKSISNRTATRPAPTERSAERALEVVAALSKNAPEDSIALRILGQMHLSQGNPKEASEVLRRGVFLDAADPLTRYFYALSLREVGDSKQALRQLRNVKGDLEARPAAEKLSDQATTAGELLTAAHYLEGQWT